MNTKGRILVADDESSLRMLLKKELTREGYEIDTASDGEEVLDKVRDRFYHVVLLDIVMPKIDGITVLSQMKKENISSEVIVLTGNASVEKAVECIRLGACEFVKKPYDLNELLINIERAIEQQKFKLDMQNLKSEIERRGGRTKLVGNSKAAKELKRIIRQVAPTESTVLILGDSGTGKEVTARSILDLSRRRSKPFVAINCASLSETLLESELFGHEKGSFTDAKTTKRGLAEIADGGTLFLDEIGEIPLQFQAKLLRFLETGEIRRVGGTKDIKLDVRILCATNKALEHHVEQKTFRADLYYRLNVLSITVPTLRERIEDIPLLVEHILAGLSFAKQFSKEAIAVLMKYSWPGNIRELRNVVERSCILSSGSRVEASDLSFLNLNQNHVSDANIQNKQTLETSTTSILPENSPIEHSTETKRENTSSATPNKTPIVSLKEMERIHIVNVLKHVNGHKGKAAEILQINPKTLYYKMKNYNIVTEFK